MAELDDGYDPQALIGVGRGVAHTDAEGIGASGLGLGKSEGEGVGTLPAVGVGGLVVVVAGGTVARDESYHEEGECEAGGFHASGLGWGLALPSSVLLFGFVCRFSLFFPLLRFFFFFLSKRWRSSCAARSMVSGASCLPPSSKERGFSPCRFISTISRARWAGMVTRLAAVRRSVL